MPFSISFRQGLFLLICVMQSFYAALMVLFLTMLGVPFSVLMAGAVWAGCIAATIALTHLAEWVDTRWRMGVEDFLINNDLSVKMEKSLNIFFPILLLALVVAWVLLDPAGEAIANTIAVGAAVVLLGVNVFAMTVSIWTARKY